MPITQYDSTNPAAIPDTAQQVVVYIDGLYRQVWANALAAGRFANTPKRRIACVTVNTPSDTADFERYDLNPPDVVPWHANMTALGETNLWAYASRSERVAVEDAAWTAGIRDLSMWIATLDGTQVVAPYRYPVAAVQYTDTGSVDLSVVYQTFGGGGGIITSPSRRKLILATTTTLHEFIRGLPDASGTRALWHRMRKAGSWSAWVSLGGNLSTPDISGGVDDQGHLAVTVCGSDGQFYDTVSTDDGATWGGFSASGGKGDGLVTIGGGASATPATVHVIGSITGTIGGSFSG